MSMKRRDFITLLGGAAAWPHAARAQQERVRRLGFLGAATSAVGGPWLSVLVQRLGELGWTEGRNLQIDARWAEGRNDRAAEIAAEFARANVDLIVTWATGPALAAKRATSTIPIVCRSTRGCFACPNAGIAEKRRSSVTNSRRFII